MIIRTEILNNSKVAKSFMLIVFRSKSKNLKVYNLKVLIVQDAVELNFLIELIIQ